METDRRTLRQKIKDLYVGPKEVTINLSQNNNFVPVRKNEASELKTINVIAGHADELYQALKHLTEYVQAEYTDRNIIMCRECKAHYEKIGMDCEDFGTKCPEPPELVKARTLVNRYSFDGAK